MKVLLVAGTRSGDGKTTFAVGLMGALRQRGLVVQAFKVGPDQLDPLLHEAATGRPSYNLDGWLRSRENNTRRVTQIATSAGDDVDIAIVEGGETLFDADDSCLSGETGSAAEIAKWLGAPVLLIVDCSTQSARGAAATVRGHVAFDEHLTIAGVILNKTEDEAHESKVREAIAAALPNVPVLGALRRDAAAAALGPSETNSADAADAFAAQGVKAAAALSAGGGNSIGGALVGAGSFSGETDAGDAKREELNVRASNAAGGLGTKNQSENDSPPPRPGNFVAGVAAQLAHVVGRGCDLNAVLGAARAFVADNPEETFFEKSISAGDGTGEAPGFEPKTFSGDTHKTGGASPRAGSSSKPPRHPREGPGVPTAADLSNSESHDPPETPRSGETSEKEKAEKETPKSPKHGGQSAPRKTPSKREVLRGAVELVGNVASHLGPALRLGRGVGHGAQGLLPRPLFERHGGGGVRLGVARDAAFCHYFRENLVALELAGAELVPFSPIAGEGIPTHVKGLLFGGGYPELHAERLANNRPLRAAVTAFAASGGVVYGECGGLTFLSQSLADQAGGKPTAMCGLAPFSTKLVLGGKHVRNGLAGSCHSSEREYGRGGSQNSRGCRGYVVVTANHGCPLFPAGATLRGYVTRRSVVVQEPALVRGYGVNGASDDGVVTAGGGSHTNGQGVSNSGNNSAWFAAYQTRRAGRESAEPCFENNPENVPTVTDLVRKIETNHRDDRDDGRRNDLTGLGVVEGYAWRNVLVSYARLHWGDQPTVAAHFVETCRAVPHAAADAAVRAAAAAVAAAPPQVVTPGGYGSAPSLPQLQGSSSDSITGLANDRQLERNDQWGSPTRLHKGGSVSNASSQVDLPSMVLNEAGPGSNAAGFGSRGSQGKLSSMDGSGSGASSSSGTNAAGQKGSQKPPASHRRAQSLSEDMDSFPPFGGNQSVKSGNGSHNGTGTHNHNGNQNSHSPINKSQSMGNVLMRKSASSASFGSVASLSQTQPGTRAGSPIHANAANLELEAFLSFPPASGSQRTGRGSGLFDEHFDADSQHGAHAHTPAATPQPRPDFHCQIACLSPAATEIVHALGLQSRLACVTDRCDYPVTVQRAFPIVLRSRERAGGAANERAARRMGTRRESISTAMYNAEKAGTGGFGFGPTGDRDRGGAGGSNQHAGQSAASVSVDVEWLRRSRPGLVLAQDACGRCVGGHGDGVVARALAAAGLLGKDGAGEDDENASDDDTGDGDGDGASKRGAVGVLALDPQRLGEVLETIAQVGAATGTGDAATALVGQLRERLRQVAARVATAQRKPRVLSLEGLRPFAVGGHWLPEMKLLAGGVDELLEPGSAAVALRWEQVLAYAPQVLVLAPCVSQSPTQTLLELERLAALPGWWALPAVRDREVYVAHHAFFSRAGPRLVVGVEILAKMLHPSLARDVAMPDGHGAFKMKMEPNRRCRPRQLHKFFQPWGGAGDDGWGFVETSRGE